MRKLARTWFPIVLALLIVGGLLPGCGMGSGEMAAAVLTGWDFDFPSYDFDFDDHPSWAHYCPGDAGYLPLSGAWHQTLAEPHPCPPPERARFGSPGVERSYVLSLCADGSYAYGYTPGVTYVWLEQGTWSADGRSLTLEPHGGEQPAAAFAYTLLDDADAPALVLTPVTYCTDGTSLGLGGLVPQVMTFARH